ncbi:hypothetical protein [Nonomuraea sp. NPDC048916]|uniref:hypothetical protein n=1 Tax=Nonomuraea sp. NPDC048916 TaxID=3154232 RepID=UPI0033EF9BED
MDLPDVLRGIGACWTFEADARRIRYERTMKVPVCRGNRTDGRLPTEEECQAKKPELLSEL